MTNYEFLKSEKATVNDLANFGNGGCAYCVYKRLFNCCYDAGVTCAVGKKLWLLAEREEKKSGGKKE